MPTPEKRTEPEKQSALKIIGTEFLVLAGVTTIVGIIVGTGLAIGKLIEMYIEGR